MGKSPILWGVLGVVVGVALGYFYADQAATSKYEPQIEIARSAVPSVSAIYFVSGTVKNVRADSFTLGDIAPSGDPFMEVPSEMTVTVGPNTAIVKRGYKDLTEFQAEFTEYQELLNELPAGSIPPEAPLSYAEVAATLADLQEGLHVEVYSNTDIKNITRFEASQVVFQ